MYDTLCRVQYICVQASPLMVLILLFVLGLLKVPKWLQILLALATGVIMWNMLGGGPSLPGFILMGLSVGWLGRLVGHRCRGRGAHPQADRPEDKDEGNS